MKLTLGFVCLLLIFSLTSSTEKTKPHKNTKSRSKSRSRPTVVGVGGVDGHHRNIHNAEYMVGMMRLYEQYHEYICAGVIITKLWAVTSPSCAGRPTKSELLLGKVVLRGGTKWIEGTGGFDHRISRTDNLILIALIKVKDPFINDPYEMPVPLIASQRYNFSRSQIVEYLGWDESIYRGTASQVLTSSTVQLMSNTDCEEYIPEVAHFPNELVCAKNLSGILCQGSGGGPLVAGNLLIGISFPSSALCDPNMPGLYARISASQYRIMEHVDDKEIQFFPLSPQGY